MKSYWIEWDSRRGNGVVRWRDADGVKHRDERAFTDKASLKLRKSILEEKDRKELLGIVDESRTPAACIAAFKEERGREICEARMGKVYEAVFKRFLEAPSPTDMSSVTSQTIADFRASLYRAELADSTISSYMSVIRAWLSWAKARKWLAKNPYEDYDAAKLLRIPHPQRIDRYFTDEEIEKIEAQIHDEEFRCIFRLGYMAGLRIPNEVLRIQSAHRAYDDRRRLHLLTIPADDTKTNRGRTVVLYPGVVAVWPKKLGPVFADWSERRIHRHFARAKLRAGITDRRLKNGRTVVKTIYWTRHTFARQFLERGGDINVLQILMGHSSFKVTIDTYGHLSKGFILEHAANLPRKPEIAKIGGAMAGQNSENWINKAENGVTAETMETVC